MLTQNVLFTEEELEASDVENSATDDHKEIEEKPNLKRKRRRREIDMVRIDSHTEKPFCYCYINSSHS